MKKTFNVLLRGCDASTRIEFELTSPQLKLLQEIACAVNVEADAEYCMPSLIVWPVGEREPEPYFEVPDGAA